MPQPHVTVIIDTYNHERFIAEAIASVLEQDFPASEREILVIDDGSTDGTPEAVKKFVPQVRYLRKANGGQASAFNASVPEARGELVAFLDGDDWWAKEKLRLAVGELDQNPELGCVGHGHFEVHLDGRPMGVVIPERKFVLHFRDLATARLYSHLRCFFGTTKITIRKALLERILPVPEELVIEADEYIFTLAPALAPALVLDKPLFYYRFHAGNLFQHSDRDTVKMRRKYEVLAVLVDKLPPQLRGFGVPDNIIDALIEPVWVDAERMRLMLEGGNPWQTFRVERASYRYTYSERPLGYRMFNAMVLASALVLPPRRFYKLRQWYASKNLHKLRSLFGSPTPTAPILENRPGV